MSKTITMEPLKIIFASIALMISLCMMPQTLVAEENFPLPTGAVNDFAGVISAEKGLFVPADKNLRAALPLIQGQPSMQGPALFYLGMANYQLGKMTNNKAKVLEGSKFSEQSMAIPGPYQDQARHNSLVMKDDAAKMR